MSRPAQVSVVVGARKHHSEGVGFGGHVAAPVPWTDSLNYHAVNLSCRFVERLSSCAVARAFDEPLVVVGLDESGDRLPKVVDFIITLEPCPQALLFQGADEALSHAVALGFADEGGVVFDAQPVEGTLEVVSPVLAAPVVAGA